MPIRPITFIVALVFIVSAKAGNPIARFQTELGNIDVVLLQDIAPNTVANFRGYVGRGDYNNSFMHRSVPNFVLQGGGYKYINGNVVTVPQQAPIANEFRVSNTRGTLAMAKLSGDPNSATCQWFFNESDSNAPNLDAQNGGFTVFGRITGVDGLAVLDALAALPTYNFGAPFDTLPLRNYTSGAPVQDTNLVHVISLTVSQTSLTLSRPSANVIHLQAAGTPNTAYRLESSTTLASANFLFVATLTSDASGTISYDDLSPGPQKLYRLTLP